MSEFHWDQLKDAEFSYSNRVSFERVMEMREKKKKRRALFWWFSSAGALFLGIATYCLLNESIEMEANSSLKQGESEAQTSLDQTPIVENSSEKIVRKSSGVRPKTYVLEGSSKPFSAAKSPEAELMEELFVAALEVDADDKEFGKGWSPLSINNQGTEVSEFGGSILKQSNLWERIYSLGLTPSYAEWADPFALRNEYFDDRLLADHDISRRFQPSLFAEFTAFTGSHNAVNFDNRDLLSVLGTQYHAHYQMAVLKDFGNGNLAGIGFGYGEWVGNGQYRNRSLETFTQIDTFQIVVAIPGMPSQTVEVVDTTTFTEWSETTGMLNYKISKISIPLAYRKYLPLGKTVWRMSLQASPGMTTRTEGTYFTRTDYLPLSTRRQFTFDGRVAFGPAVPLSNIWTLVLEPNLFAQSFLETQSRSTKTKIFSGFGVSLVGKL